MVVEKRNKLFDGFYESRSGSIYEIYADGVTVHRFGKKSLQGDYGTDKEIEDPRIDKFNGRGIIYTIPNEDGSTRIKPSTALRKMSWEEEADARVLITLSKLSPDSRKNVVRALEEEANEEKALKETLTSLGFLS